jgi:hypothetical protein
MKLEKINNEAEYDDAIIYMNQLLDVIGDDEKHPSAIELKRVGDMVSDYENIHFKFINSLVNPKMTKAEEKAFLEDAERWDSGELGCDAKHAVVAGPEHVIALDEALGINRKK